MTDVIFMSAESRTKESRTKDDDENVIFMNDKNQTNSSVSTKEDDDEVEMYDPARDEDNDSWIESRLSKLSTTKALTWRYKNDEGKPFGPFTPEQMNAWVQGGYFPATLMVSSSGTSTFVPLSSLKNPFGTKKNKVVLSCPCCFVVLSYQAKLLSRKHKTTYVTSETVNCRVNTNERLESTSSTSSSSSLHPLLCLSCGTEVGTCNLEQKKFTFLQGIPGY